VLKIIVDIQTMFIGEEVARPTPENPGGNRETPQAHDAEEAGGRRNLY
jgi:hypothetical protein